MGAVHAIAHQSDSASPIEMPRIAVDNRGVIQAWNHAAQELLGYSRRQTLGRSVTVLLADGEASTAGAGSPAGPACVDRHGEVTLRHRDGHLVSCCLQQFAALAGEFGVLLSRPHRPVLGQRPRRVVLLDHQARIARHRCLAKPGSRPHRASISSRAPRPGPRPTPRSRRPGPLRAPSGCPDHTGEGRAGRRDRARSPEVAGGGLERRQRPYSLPT